MCKDTNFFAHYHQKTEIFSISYQIYTEDGMFLR